MDTKLISIRPSENQVAWQSLEFTAFLHFGMNTFTNREWGDGTELPSSYNPSNLDTDQWCQVLKNAGVKACIITAKHHDGFCLFDTSYTKHNVMQSPKPVDVVAELSKSCLKYGLKMGVYLSPWDRHEASYGSGKAYDDYFCAQLEELTTKYDTLYSVWFDGACGEGKNGKKQIYDWDRYYDVIRKNQPQAVIAVCGPDVRWIGNEAGQTRPSEWSVVSSRLKDAERIASLSQTEDDERFRLRPIKSTDEDLGSRAVLADEDELCWYPAEVDVSIRPGWFYHPEEDDKVRSVENLLKIYEKSVGGNAVLLLNIPPDTTGNINIADAQRLKELGERIRSIYSHNLLEGVKTLPNQLVSHVVLCEDIRQSQRIEAFRIEAQIDGTWQEIYRATTVGYKKICRFKPVCVSGLRIVVEECRAEPIISFVGAYYDEWGKV